jgi:CoA:oxalate CoA-transferase
MYPFMGGISARRRQGGGNFQHPMPCADGWIIVQIGAGRTWMDVAAFFGSSEMEDPKFSDANWRDQNGKEVDRVVLNTIKDRSKWDLFTKAGEARVLFGIVQTPSELAECPQLKSRNFFREVDHPVIGKIKVPAVLFNLSLTPYALRWCTPTVGQHNQEIYVDGLGYSQQEMCQLRQLNVI